MMKEKEGREKRGKVYCETMKLKDLKIGTQLRIGLGTIMVLVAILGATAWFQAEDLWQATKELYDHPLQVRRALNSIEVDMLTIHRNMKDLVMADNEQERQSIIQAIDTSEADANLQFDILYDRYLGPRKEIDEIRTAFDSWKTIRTETIRLVRIGKAREAYRRTKAGGVGGEQVEKLQNRIQKMINFARDRADKFYADAQNEKDTLLRHLWIILGAIVLMLLGVSYVLLKNIKNPLEELTSLTEQFSQGKLDVRSNYTSANEFGTLAASFNKLASTIQTHWLNKESADRIMETLRESEEKFSKAFQTSPYAITITRPSDGTFVDVNDAFTSMTGFTREEGLAGSSIGLKLWVSDEDRQSVVDALSKGQGVAGKEYQFRVKSGEIITGLFSAQVIHLSQGSCILSSINDITERKQAEEVISAKNKELENYLYIASHDLRSPLVNIHGFSQRLQKQADSIKAALTDCALPPATKAGIDTITDVGIPKTLNFIFSSVKKMDTLLNGLLHLSRTGRARMTIKEIDINQLFQTIIANFNFQLTQLDARIIAKDLPSCYGDQNLLNSLFSNIIANAIKYHDKNRGLVIEITAQNEFRKVIYSISDNGLGIESRHLEKIWDILYRVDSTLADAGEGLGLSIVKRIAEKHKGRVWVESAIGKGSVFYVELQTSEFSES